ncbi:MAG: hypothetical protein WC908_03350 [Candidatus Paceibacterota bacterium]
MNKALTVGLIAVFCLVTGFSYAADVAVDHKGSRAAAGYFTDESANPTFGVADAKLRLNAKVDEMTSAVLRIDAPTMTLDYAYIQLDNVVSKLVPNLPINPVITAGKFKIDFGEETWYNNPVEGALVFNSVADVSGNDNGLMLKQNDFLKNMPLIFGYSLSFMNGATVAVDNNTNKAFSVKATGQMKTMPLYFSLSYYSATGIPCTVAQDAALNVNGSMDGVAVNWSRKVFELNARFDMIEGAAKFTPEKTPLFSESKGVFGLTYGTATDGEPVIGKITYGYVALSALYNVDPKMYVAFRYSYNDVAVDRNSTLDGKFTRTQIGGGYKVSSNTTLKFEYTMDDEPDTALAAKVDNNKVALIVSTLW